MRQLVIFRGWPGSGKSTEAREFIKLYKKDGFEVTAPISHFEADMFFYDENLDYVWDPTKLPKAHKWCQTQTFNALKAGETVVVSNTFTRLEELAPYIGFATLLGIPITIFECSGNFDNIHNCPADKVLVMKNRMEKIPLLAGSESIKVAIQC